MNIRDLLEKQILKDAEEGDTTVLAELLEQLDYDTIFNALSDENQKIAEENKYLCNRCHDIFTAEEMDFDVEDDQDLCKNCNHISSNDAPYGSDS
jgi:late competence protein required for DNA uptake (superfamily II DNA/RNA helicase)